MICYLGGLLVTEGRDDYNETQLFKDLQKEAKSLAKWFDKISKIKYSDQQFLVKLDKALQTLPEDTEFLQLYGDFKRNIQSFIVSAHTYRANNIKRLAAAYIRSAQQAGIQLREFTRGWRLGPLELQVDLEQAQISFWYNHENLIKWQSVGTVEDIQKAEQTALTMLEKAALPAEVLIQVFWEAYLEARRRNSRSLDASLVSLNEFYREVRITLIRNRLNPKKPNMKIDRYVEFPKYAFLYNIDLYRQMSSQIPAEIRLAWQTGSMNEVNKGNGMIVNGLDAINEYKVMCYVRQAAEG